MSWHAQRFLGDSGIDCFLPDMGESWDDDVCEEEPGKKLVRRNFDHMVGCPNHNSTTQTHTGPAGRAGPTAWARGPPTNFTNRASAASGQPPAISLPPHCHTSYTGLQHQVHRLSLSLVGSALGLGPWEAWGRLGGLVHSIQMMMNFRSFFNGVSRHGHVCPPKTDGSLQRARRRAEPRAQKGLLWALRLEVLELLIIIGLMSLMPRSRTELKNILFDHDHHDPTGVLGAQVCLRPLLFQSRPPAPGMMK